MRLTRYSIVFVLGLILLASCVTTQPTPGPLTPTPGANQHELTGHYYKDKFYFFPMGRNFKIEDIFLQALREGAVGKFFEPSKAFGPEQNLAIEYDAAATAVKISNNAYALESYGIVLGKVGRWKEAAEAFKKASGISNASAGVWGNLGVALHALGNYNASVESFAKAESLGSSYFDSRPNQKMIWLASKDGRQIMP